MFKFVFSSKKLSKFLISIDPQQGRFLYNMVLSKKPDVIFEYGLSYGVSTIYLAQALKNSTGGLIISAEIDKRKINNAEKNIKTFNLLEHVDILEGDIQETIDKIDSKIDFVHMDGFPNLNLVVLQKIEAKLNQQAIVITDDANLFKREMKDYIQYLYQSGKYSNTWLNMSDGVILSIKL